jgi:post-segregation antitoxin (ccd killing protein)
MTAKIGISLPDETYARARAAAANSKTSISGLINEALLAELARRAAAEHVAMLAEAEDPQRLGQRARARTDTLAAWKRTG